MCEGQSAAWHPRPQYEVVLQREQRSMSWFVTPQCAQVLHRLALAWRMTVRGPVNRSNTPTASCLPFSTSVSSPRLPRQSKHHRCSSVSDIFFSHACLGGGQTHRQRLQRCSHKTALRVPHLQSQPDRGTGCGSISVSAELHRTTRPRMSCRMHSQRASVDDRAVKMPPV